jgi:hypothetical protein
MLYPYKHKFLYFDEIKEALSGYGRFIYYRAMQKRTTKSEKEKNILNYDKLSTNPSVIDFDPTHNNNNENWILSINEGRFNKG